MKKKRKDQFLQSGEDTGSNKNKIELLSCPHTGKDCKDHLSLINQSFSESHIYKQNKNFQGSIEALKNAFEKTNELQDLSCSTCAEFFRSTIALSLENMHDELNEMSTGIFGRKRYQSSYKAAGNVLKEFRKAN